MDTKRSDTAESALIRRRIEEAKISLGKNVNRFERGAGAMVNIADRSVRESVNDAKEAVDPRVHIRQRPLLALGASVVTGFVIGRALGRSVAVGNHIGTRIRSSDFSGSDDATSHHRLRDGAIAIANVLALEAVSKLFPSLPGTITEIFQRWNSRAPHPAKRPEELPQRRVTAGPRDSRIDDLEMH